MHACSLRKQEVAYRHLPKLRHCCWVHAECLHGVKEQELAEGGTTYPSPLGMAASWDESLVFKIGSQVSFTRFVIMMLCKFALLGSTCSQDVTLTSCH